VSGPSSVVAVERKTPASASEETSSRAEVSSQSHKLGSYMEESCLVF